MSFKQTDTHTLLSLHVINSEANRFAVRMSMFVCTHIHGKYVNNTHALTYTHIRGSHSRVYMSRKRQVMGGHRGLTSEQSRLLIFSVTHTLLKRFPHTTSVCQLERASAAASQPEITIAKAVHSPHELLRAWCGEHGQPHETKMGPLR